MNREIICLSFILLLALFIIVYDMSTRETDVDLEELLEYELLNDPF